MYIWSTDLCGRAFLPALAQVTSQSHQQQVFSEKQPLFFVFVKALRGEREKKGNTEKYDGQEATETFQSDPILLFGGLRKYVSYIYWDKQDLFTVDTSIS